MFLTLAEAKRELAKFGAGRNPNGSMTLDQWHERYWPAIESSVRPGTARCYDVGWRLRVRPSLGRHRLEDITSPMIESAMVTWSGGASAKNDAPAVLSRLLDAARRARFIDHNPAREVKRPGTRESVSPISQALTVEQVSTLLALVHSDQGDAAVQGRTAIPLIWLIRGAATGTRSCTSSRAAFSALGAKVLVARWASMPAVTAPRNQMS